MSIPLPTTTIAVFVPDADADPYKGRAITQVETGVPAHFSSPRGFDILQGGEQATIDMRLDCDICEMPHTAFVVDEQTGEQWKVVGPQEKRGLGLDHIEAGVQRVEGAIPS